MCSISGIYNFYRESNIDKIVLENMSLNLKHRGPDGSGQYIDHFIGLAHNRLSILDTSNRSGQPFKAHNKVLVFNGLIFNYKELRNELERLGYQFKTNSDTEVVLVAYHHWGDKCQSRFNGMWAFVIYDEIEKTLFFSRDRYGIKPLYYTEMKNQFYFASEVKAFHAIPDFKYILNPKRFSEYLATGALEYDEQTLFKNIIQVKPGHSITISEDDKALKQKKYYTLTRDTFNGTYETAQLKFKQLFDEAVNKRLVSDVSIGLSLSGGIDSNAILANIPTNSIKNILSFSSSDSTDPLSEHQLIKKSAAHFKIKNHQIAALSNDFFNQIDDLIYTQEIPFFSTSIFAQNQVFELTKKKNTSVSLSGQGADEMLMGYDLFVKQQILSNPISFLCSPNKWYYLKKKKRKKTSWVSLINSKYYALPLDKSYNSALELAHNLFTKTVLPSLLHFEDRNSMKYAVESRLPFLDHELVDFIFTLESKHLLGKFERKKILKESLADKIPSFILNNKVKSAFYTPSQKWFTQLPQYFINDAKAKIKRHNNFFNANLNLEELNGEDLFKAGMIAKWLDRFNVEY